MLNVLIKLYFTIKLKQNKKGGARRGYAKVKKTARLQGSAKKWRHLLTFSN